MVKQIINSGVLPNDGQGDNLRAGAIKINNNFTELYTALGNGTALTVINNNLITATGGNRIAFYFDNQAAFPSASTYHGAVAHSHADGAMYFAHGGAWTKLISTADSINALSDVDTTAAPTNGQALLWDSISSNWKPGTVSAGGGGGSGVTTFLALTDTPSTFSGSASKYVKVNSGSNALEFVSGVQSADLNAISINALSDVDTATVAPTAGQVLKWNGSQWTPAADATAGGGGSNADTLDGFDSTYFLNYNNLTNTPTTVSTFLQLTDTPATFSGSGGRFVKVNAGATALEFVAPTAVVSTLDDLTDVTIVSPELGDVLYYNGTAWVKQNGPIIRWSLSQATNSVYIFTGPGFPTATNNPTLYLHRGHTYIFNNTVHTNHPLNIRVSSGGAAYTDGVSGAGTAVITFTVPMSAPSTLYYQCGVHGSMGQTINVVT